MGMTMQEIAKLAGVSRQAVSAVFNNPEGCRIPEATQKRIRQVAQQYGYVPNAMARSLKGASSRMVGIIGTPPYFGVSPSLFRELVNILREKGMDITFRISENKPANPALEIRELENKGVDGIITLDNFFDRQYFSVPSITIDKEGNFDVGCSRFQGLYMATEHLISHGRRRIALLEIAEHSVPGRHDGWRRACEEKLGECDKSLIIYGKNFDFSFDKLAELIRTRHIDGICAQNDYVAGRTVRELMRRGVKVPEDVAVMGFDGNSFCDFCAVSLATIITPVREQAKIAVDMLLQRIKAKEVNAPYAGITVPPILHTSASCGCPECQEYPFYKLNTFQSIEQDILANFNEDITKI